MNSRTTRRLVWPALLTIAVLITWGARSSLVAADDGRVQPGITLGLPLSYLFTSPISRLLDLLTLLSVPQTTAFFTVPAVFILIVSFAKQSMPRRPGWLRLLITPGSILLGVLLIEAAVALAPRPMARIAVEDPNVVVVDFHSHTKASRDANQRFTGEDRREWHRDGGFNIGYITDHVRFGEAAEAARRNPVRAGLGVSELVAVEGRYHRIISTIMLGLTRADSSLLDSRGRLLPGSTVSGRQPVTIVTLPNRNLDSVTVESLDSIPRFAAIELVDAAPRGLGQLDRDEDKVRQISDSLHLVLVAASNNHGYGRTVAAWNLLTLYGWRDMAPDSVGQLIEGSLRQRNMRSVMIVKRLRPRTHGITTVLTLPVGIFQILGSLTPAERFVWLVWIWGIAGLMRLRKKRRRVRSTHDPASS